MEELDFDLIGTVGRISVPISKERSGEVLLPVRGGTEAFEACADQPIAKNTKVVVVDCLSGRTVTVTPVA
jgi:membrane protein implicated in regulation of membrane protease activity